MDDSLQLFCLYAFREKHAEVGIQVQTRSNSCATAMLCLDSFLVNNHE